jgi:hypothetical protein
MENNNTIVWTNSPLSGLCDRLIDFFLIATYCKLNESNFISIWRPLHSNTRDGKSFYQTNENNGEISKFFKEVRYSDYKHENFLKYFELPKNTLIENHKLNILSFPNLSYFDGYIGGVESPITFYEKYVVNDDRILNPNSPFKKNKSNITKEEFVKTFYSVCNSFQPTKKLIEISKINVIPDLTIHLRREDKIRLSKFNGELIDYRELNNLNDVTKLAIDSFLEKKPNAKLLFCSDNEEEKLKFEKLYIENIIKTPTFEFDFEQTYYDLYIMSISKNILLSQRYSGFSMFSSFINKNNFVYLLEDGQIIHTKWSELENICHYKDWLKLI